jgi:TonB-linked SusC/RagA family outer membrane protein
MGLANAQTKVITGNVTGADDGLPIPGVTVMVPGTTVGTTTDFDGNYTVSVSDDATVLSFSFIGMVAQEVQIGGRSVINVVLQTSSTALDEVVVTALGISREKKALGYSVTEVGADEIEGTPATDVVNALAGKVAGVRINNSTGAAGGSTFVEIRGSASITRNNQPLYVIDGIPIQSGGGSGGVAGVATSNRTIDINPDDIESMSVLKGAAATALYGLRAGNGVIMITTKKGKAQKGLNINFSSSVKIDQISQTPALNTKYAQGSIEYTDYLANWYDMNPDYVADPDQRWYNGVSWGPRMDTLRYSTDPNYVPGDLYWNGGTASMEDYMKNWDPNGRIVGMSSPYAGSKAVTPYDHYDFFQTGYTYSNSLNVSGGNDVSTFYLSFSNMQQEGVVPNNTFDRNTFKLSGSTKPAEGLTVSSSVTYTNTKGHRIQQGSNISGVMLGLMRTPPSFDNSAGYRFPSDFRNAGQRTYRNGGGYDNPYWVANEIGYDDDVNRLLGNILVSWDINDWMKLSYRGGIDFVSNYARDYYAPGSNDVKPGYASSFHSTSTDQNHDLYLNITRDLTEDLKLTGLVGYNMYETKYGSTTSEANDIIIANFYDVANTTDVKGYEDQFSYRTKAFYADVNLAYKSMLYLGLTGRYEWSTTLPESNNAFFYPAATLGFVFSELPVFKDMEWLTFGKIRASYADIANTPPAYVTRTYFFQGGAGDGWTSDGVSFPFNSVNGYTLGGTIGSADLKPESSKEWELGLTANLFNSRVTVDLAYFNRKNEDLLLNVPVASSSGYSSRYMNAASMETKGFEILVNATVVKLKDFTWDLTVNWSNPNTVVTELAPGVPNVFLGGFTEPQVRAVAGSQYRSIYGFAWLRDDAGRLIVNDDASNGMVGYPLQDPETQLLGSVQSDWNMGITNTFSYKGFTLSSLIDIKHGGQMWNGTKGALYYFGAHKDTENRDDDYTFDGVYGHLDGDGNLVTSGVVNTDVVKLDEDWRFWSGLGSGFTGPSEDYVEDAGWVRLRELTLAYNFSNLVSDVKWIKRLEVYFTGYNLWISTPYTGIDPETSLLGSSNAQGFDYFNMPGTKSYTFGVKVGF